jgi:hypothetical protein
MAMTTPGRGTEPLPAPQPGIPWTGIPGDPGPSSWPGPWTSRSSCPSGTPPATVPRHGARGLRKPRVRRLHNAACVRLKVDSEERRTWTRYMTAAQAWAMRAAGRSSSCSPPGPALLAVHSRPRIRPSAAGSQGPLPPGIRALARTPGRPGGGAETLARRLRSLEIGETGPIPGRVLQPPIRNWPRLRSVHGASATPPKFPSRTPCSSSCATASRRNERGGGHGRGHPAGHAPGGIFDRGLRFPPQLHGPPWLLPPFEKMLYDQALLPCLPEGFRSPGPGLADTAGRSGPTCCATWPGPEALLHRRDADAQDRRRFYVLTLEEFLPCRGALPGAARSCPVFGSGRGQLSRRGQAGPRANVLHLPRALEERRRRGLESRELAGMIETCSRPLAAGAGGPAVQGRQVSRTGRPDGRGPAACGRILESPARGEAERAATFLRGNLRG